MRMELDLKEAKEVIGEYSLKRQAVEKLLKEFYREGLVQNLNIDRDRISYKYKNLFVKRVLRIPKNLSTKNEQDHVSYSLSIRF